MSIPCSAAAVRPNYSTTEASFALESHIEAHAHAVVDELEVVDVLLALLVLEEVREVIPDLELGPAPPAVRDSGVSIRVSLLQEYGAALLPPAVDLGEATTGHRHHDQEHT